MPHDPRGSDLLAVVFGTTLVVWSVLYLAAVPPGLVPPRLAAVVVALSLFGAGFVLGRAGRSWRGGLAGGLGIGAVGLLVLASLLGGAASGEMARGLGWVGGFLAAASALGAGGAMVGHRQAPSAANWTARFAWITALTVLAMIAAGGVVTGLEAGLAVEGWLNAEGHFLPLFPLELMRRDVPTFVEHAHRLWGLLVGLSTIALAVQLFRVDRRRWLRGLALCACLVVIVQGVLGGTRVTEQSIALGVIHGVLAHAILAALFVLAAACSSAWQGDQPPASSPSAATERTLSALLLVAVLVQITLGTMFRHLQPDPETPRGMLMGLLYGHSFAWSLVVIVLALLAGLRAWGKYRAEKPLRRTGVALVYTLALQVVLGFVAFVVVPKGVRPPQETITAVEVAVTSAHQVIGSLLLAFSALLVAWTRRRLTLRRGAL